MIVINGTVSEEIKKHLLAGGTCPPHRRHGNLVIAGGSYTGGTDVPCKKIVFVVTGDEAFTFQAANNAMYHKYTDYINIPHGDVVYATCTHFTWGSGAVIADMKDGEFILNYTKATGIGTGNVTFKNDTLFTSAADAKAWFKEQYAKGTPVTVVAYVKE